MRKQDLLIGAGIGFISGIFAIFIINNIVRGIGLEIPVYFIFTLPFIIALLSAAAVVIAVWLGRKIPVIFQASKFALVGVLNTMIDIGVLNILILVSGVASGLAFSVFKGISFLVSVTNSYFFNKFWTFKSEEAVRATEFAEFAAIAGVGFLINVGIASFVVNIIGPRFGATPEIWANIGAITATLTAMTWNFLGYKFIVFKSRSDQ